MKLAEKLDDLEEFKEQEIVTLCPGGGKSLVAVEIMNKAGFKDVKSLKGGIWLLEKKGYPTIKSEDSKIEKSESKTFEEKRNRNSRNLPLA
ncbi:MAG: hypothetical protein HeimC3_37830 [Candidatus Heimdallarchaeota archaeon LC_3]|nr:MAG: hypothetical protein HeimC3_50560 [Candidatus Heimdallarchaeota archaeon LC_3]OLS21034.1 MAG: hypothetical protein HeimC3_37830 [Candidatus Heimdallarchaeota archaeon LC_3]